MNQFSLLVYLLLVKETMMIARPSFASNTTEKPPVVVPFGRRAPASAKTSVNAYDTEIHKRFESFFVQFDEQKIIKKERKKRSNLSLLFGQTNTHATFTNNLISLSLSLFPSFRANGEEKKERG